MAGRRADIGSLGQIGIGRSPVALQTAKDAKINAVEF
jgi:hypothetical protein